MGEQSCTWGKAACWELMPDLLLQASGSGPCAPHLLCPSTLKRDFMQIRGGFQSQGGKGYFCSPAQLSERQLRSQGTDRNVKS